MGGVNLSAPTQLASSVGTGAGLSRGPSGGCPWHKSGGRGGPVQDPASVCATARMDLYLGVIAKSCGFGLKSHRNLRTPENRWQATLFINTAPRNAKTLNL